MKFHDALNRITRSQFETVERALPLGGSERGRAGGRRDYAIRSGKGR